MSLIPVSWTVKSQMYYIEQSRLFVFVSLVLLCFYCLFMFRIIRCNRNGLFLFLISCAPFCWSFHGAEKSCKIQEIDMDDYRVHLLLCCLQQHEETGDGSNESERNMNCICKKNRRQRREE